MKFVYSLFLMLFMSASAFALTFEDAISLALQNNDSLKQNRSLVDAQEYKKNAAFAPFLPYANLTYGYHETAFSGIPDNSLTIPRDTTKESAFGVNLGYNLFNGFYDWNNYKLGAASLLMQEYTYRGTKQDIILSTKTSYLSYLKSNDQLEVAKQTLTLLESQKRIAEVSYQVGSSSRSDVLRVDVQLASTQLQLLNAQINMKLARQQLEYYIGRLIPENEEVAGINLLSSYPVPLLEELYSMLEDNRSEIQYARLAYDAAGLTKRASGANYLPKVNANLDFGWNGEHWDTFNGRDSNYGGSRVIGLSASWNIFQGFANMNTYKANAKSEMASAFALSDLRKLLRLQVSNAYETYFSAREMLTVAEVGVVQARESYRVMENMFENSEATTTDLLDANVALNNALIAHSAAVYDIISTISRIERAVETEILGLNITDPDAGTR